MDALNYKNVCPEDFEFFKILKMREKNVIKSANFFVIVLYCTKRIYLQIEPQLEDGREAP